MLLLYNFSIRIYYLLVLLFSPFNQKAKNWIKGREKWANKIPAEFLLSKNAWFHFASLGEFEQGKPVLEKFKNKYPNFKIVITFFSPSGYENKKNYPLADLILYLPIDTKYNAAKFIKLIKPKIAFITKYEYWYHFLAECYSQKIPIYIISAIFRPQQIFFRYYGNLHRRMLGFVNHFFLQDKKSAQLLNSINIYNHTISGDTRFDTVYGNFELNKQIEFIKEFKNEKLTLIAGSTWPEDEKLLLKIHQKFKECKIIIAPHEIGKKRISQLKKQFDSSVLYSELNKKTDLSRLQNSPVLIINNIGLLSHLYKYADIGYIGGGFGAGIHNTLEAAVFGKVLLFGPKHQKFKEAIDLLKLKAAFSVNDDTIINIFSDLVNDKKRLTDCSKKAQNYVLSNVGATQIILDKIEASDIVI